MIVYHKVGIVNVDALYFLDPNWITTIVGLAAGSALIAVNLGIAKKTKTT